MQNEDNAAGKKDTQKKIGKKSAAPIPASTDRINDEVLMQEIRSASKEMRSTMIAILLIIVLMVLALIWLRFLGFNALSIQLIPTLLGLVALVILLAYYFRINQKKKALERKLIPLTSQPPQPTQAVVSHLDGQKPARQKPKTSTILLILAASIIAYLLIFGFAIPTVLKAAGLRSNGPTFSDLYTAGGLMNLLDGSSSVSGGNCNLPVKVISCQCSNRSSKGVWCEVDSGKGRCYTDSHGIRMCSSGQGQGWIPYKCAQQLGKCK